MSPFGVLFLLPLLFARAKRNGAFPFASFFLHKQENEGPFPFHYFISTAKVGLPTAKHNRPKTLNLPPYPAQRRCKGQQSENDERVAAGDDFLGKKPHPQHALGH